MSSWGPSEHFSYNRPSPPREERRRDSRYGEPSYGSYEDSVRDWEEQERLRQWDEYEKARMDWERRVTEYRSGDGSRRGGHGVKRARSPSPYERDSRPRRDSYDQYGGGRGRFDDGRRSPRRRYSPDSRYRREPTMPHPMDQERLIPYRAFVEWYREAHPDRYHDDEAISKENDSDRRVGLKARYDEFRADYNAKQVQILFEKHRSAAWFLEKYDPTEKYSDLRARVRKQGWQGALNNFLVELEAGSFDYVFEIPKTNQSLETKNETINEEASANGVKEEKTPTKQDGEGEDPEWTNENGKNDENDEVIIPHKGHQVMIKTIPPDIGRLRLEPVVDKLTGVVSLALGEPVARRNYYRSAWIEFNTEKEARDAMDQLAGQEVDSFKLQVTMIRSPLIAKIKRTSVLVSTDKRLEEDLETMKKLVSLLEIESDMLTNYKPLAERQAGQEETSGPVKPETDVKVETEDVKMKSPTRENGFEVEPRLHRGSAAVEARLQDKLPMPDNEENKSLRLAMSVDLYLIYLRSAFYCCYYCAVIADRADELQRKCVKHVRTPFNEKEMNEITRIQKRADREDHWFLLHDEKIETLINRDGVDPTRFGGKDFDKALQAKLRDQYRQEDDSKYRCITCSKMFKSVGYVCKHISNKHSELVGEAFNYELYNNFALDPHRIQMPPANPPPPGTGRHARDASRREQPAVTRRSTIDSGETTRKRTPPPDAKVDPRAGQKMTTYQDLDEVAGGDDIALMY